MLTILVCISIEKLVEHGRQCLTYSYTNEPMDILTQELGCYIDVKVTSSIRHSAKVLSTIFGNSMLLW